MVAGPMTDVLPSRDVFDPNPDVPHPCAVRCKACDWPVSHQSVMRGVCARCGRHLPARMLG